LLRVPRAGARPAGRGGGAGSALSGQGRQRGGGGVSSRSLVNDRSHRERAVDFAESAELQALRKTVADIAGRFGGAYYARRAAAHEPCDELRSEERRVGHEGRRRGGG